MGSCVISYHPPWLYRSIDDLTHVLGPGVDVDVSMNLYRLPVPPPMPVKGLDYLELQPKQFSGKAPVYADVGLIHVRLALAQEFEAGKSSRGNLDGEQGLKFRLGGNR